MNTVKLQYKSDTGMSSTIDIDIEERIKYNSDSFYKIYDMRTLEIFELKYEDCIRLHKPEYIKWLEEKVEAGGDILVSNLRNEIEELKYSLSDEKQEKSELEDKIYEQESEIDELKEQIKKLQQQIKWQLKPE